MVVTKVTGGLGNQMFQYAAAKRLSLKQGVPLSLDLSWFGFQTQRSYGLCHFNTTAAVLPEEQVARLTARYRGRKIRKAWFRILDLLEGKRRFRYLVQTSRGIDARVFEAAGNTYLIGFWQSEKYFADIRNTICHDFTLKDAPGAENRLLLEQIEATHSVAIHVRRGDYVSDTVTNRRHGTCDVAYYEAAVRVLHEECQGLHFFVFSDDIEWAEQNLGFCQPASFVRHNSRDEPQEDLRLMSHCKHQIIANSSLSWWGAWLNQNARKHVIAPKVWCRDPKWDTRDLVPPGWLRL